MAYCEAVSGFYLTKPQEPRKLRASPATITALARLGFDTDDSAGNFKIERSVGPPPDFNALADLILRALHDGYGTRQDRAEIQSVICAGRASKLRADELSAHLLSKPGMPERKPKLTACIVDVGWQENVTGYNFPV